MAISTMSLAKEKNFIMENWKPILGIGATIGVTYVAWSIYQDWKKTKDDNPTTKELKEDPRFEPSELTDSQALMMANRLQEAMGSLGMVSEKELKEIKSIFQGLGYNDFIKLSRAFGQRGYITLTGISKDSDFIAPKKNLSYWLSKELPSRELDALRQVIPGAF